MSKDDHYWSMKGGVIYRGGAPVIDLTLAYGRSLPKHLRITPTEQVFFDELIGQANSQLECTCGEQEVVDTAK